MFGAAPHFNTQLWSNGPSPGQFYNFPGGQSNFTSAVTPADMGKQHTSSPITTGTTVVGIKFDGGVMIAADNLISYGSLARFQDIQRVFKVNNKTVMGAGGDFADFQSLKRSIDQKMIEDICFDNTSEMKPRSLYCWLTRILYNKRSRMQQLWLDMVVGGFDEGEPFLGHVDLRGRAYEDDVVATGFGKHIVLPLVREQLVEGRDLTRDQAENVMRKCMEVLYYRDCRAMAKYTMVVCTKDGSELTGPYTVDQNWQVANMVKGY